MSEQTHSYLDWQISTLMLAYDAVDPLPRNADKLLAEREEKVRQELKDMVHAVLPKDYLENPSKEFPASMVKLLTRATLRRAGQIVGL
jgi:hypothetical protein